MFLFRNNDTVPWDECVATLGFFDGVHGGHRFLLNEVIEEARKKQVPAVVITFGDHPRKVLKSDYQPALLTTTEEKVELLSEAGMDGCVVLDFTEEVSQYSAREFLGNILHRQLKVKTLIVGYDHRFGRDRSDGFEQYRAYGAELGMEVKQAEQYHVQPDDHFSSTQIRKALLGGDLALANTLLTYPYTFIGVVIGGYRRGRKIGFPTANIWFENKEKIIPAVGVYAVWVYLKDEKYKGMMNIGYRPTFSADDSLSMEVHIIGFDEDIYDQKVKVECVHRIRDEMKFDGVEQLTAQLTLDRERVITLL